MNFTKGNEAIIAGYGRFARWYNLVYGPILQPGRRAAIDALELKDGDRVLEVGVGTGLSLPLYPDNVRVTGVDLSPDMLAKASDRASRQQLRCVEGLKQMDGQSMQFPDNSFDAVLTMYVVSVADDPVALVNEMCRVCKPNGTIVVVNHFKQTGLWLDIYHALVKPLHKAVVHRADFDLTDFVEQTDLDVVSQSSANLFSYSEILKCRNRPKKIQEKKAAVELASTASE
jgi:phosphatidylethanolamine/phosphatidyl-N-methylethanolamine N-methyltransferase